MAMDIYEEFVLAWLQNRGYFVMRNIKYGNNKDIDILAINPREKENNKQIIYHIETTFSTNPLTLLGIRDIKNKRYVNSAKKYITKKYKGTERLIKEIVGGKCKIKKWFICAKVKNAKQLEYFRKKRLKVTNIDSILKEVCIYKNNKFNGDRRLKQFIGTISSTFINMDLKDKFEKSKSPDSEYIKDILVKWSKKRKNIKSFYDDLRDNIPSSCEYDSTPGEIKYEMRKHGEDAYKKAFFVNKKIDLRITNRKSILIKWRDFEVPVVFGKNSRRYCLDLIGRVNDGFAIIELKNTSGNSPFYALYEALFYALCAKENNRKEHYLKCHLGLKNYWQEYKDSKYLIVGAPEGYWNDWRKCFKQLIEVIGWIEKAYKYKIILAQFKKEYFKKQKNRKKTYRPKLENNLDDSKRIIPWENVLL